MCEDTFLDVTLDLLVLPPQLLLTSSQGFELRLQIAVLAHQILFARLQSKGVMVEVTRTASSNGTAATAVKMEVKRQHGSEQ